MDSEPNRTPGATATSEALESPAARKWGWGFLLVACALFAAVTLPVIVNGSPLLDDFSRCVEPQKPGYWTERFRESAAFRPMRIVETVVINGLCGSVPFSFVILLPWILTIGVAFLLRALLRDLDVPAPWPEIGAGLWLLAPLGTESALWPSALHIPLGLAVVLLALRMFMRGKIILGIIFALIGYLSLEQLIFALPLAGWWVSAPAHRLRVLVLTASLSLGVLAVYVAWPGTIGHLALPLGQRLTDAFRDVGSYAIMVGTGLGAHSIPTAVQWALPVSVLVIAVGSLLGWLVGPRLLLSGVAAVRPAYRSIATGLVLLALINVPVALTFPHPDSPRIFAPSWLVLAAFAALIGQRVEWRRQHFVGAIAGGLIAGSMLSLTLSSSVRIRSARIVEEAMMAIAAETPSGGVVAVCGVTRTVVLPAPSGAFSIHEFILFPNETYEYYTGEVAELRIGGAYKENRCPDPSGVDTIFEFDELIAA
jgi:hypothetical protein